jgi:hypothetical protein
MFCENCGQKLNNELATCANCGQPNPEFRVSAKVTEPVMPVDLNTGLPREYPASPAPTQNYASKAGLPQERPVSQAPRNNPSKAGVTGEKRLSGGVVLANDEQPIRTYHCSGGRFPKCNGYLTVTNRRVLFHGASDNSRIVNEVPLDAVSGISTFYGGKVFVKRILIALALILICAFFTNTVAEAQETARNTVSIFGQADDGGFAPWFPIICGYTAALILLLTCYRKMFFLQIFSSKANAAPISIGEGYGGLGGNSAVFALSAFPTEHTGKMMLELGAMITDLQTMGDYGIKRWKRNDKRNGA